MAKCGEDVFLPAVLGVLLLQNIFFPFIFVVVYHYPL